MKKLFIALSMVAFVTLSCKQSGKQPAENPLLKAYTTPFEVPPFTQIKPEHYIPAIDSAIHTARMNIDSIIANPNPAGFQNTIEALTFSGTRLDEITSLFFNLTEADSNDTLQELAKTISPKVTAFNDEIYMNEKLFEKVKAVYSKKDSLGLNTEQMTLLEFTYRTFIRFGVNLNPQQKERLKKINGDLALLTLKFGDNVRNENNTFKLVIEKKEDLAGLPQTIIDAAAETAKKNKLNGKWVFTLQNPSVMPFLQYAENRELRKQIQQAYINRGNHNDSLDNKKIIVEILKLRIEKAGLLGYKTHSDYVLTENMAKNPQNVFDLLNKVWKATLPVARKDAAELQQIINKEGQSFKLEAWDWRYYAEKQRKLKYDLDEEQVKPYFKLENVRDGIFEVSKKLYGLSFVERKDIPLYNPEISAYEVLDSAGAHQGVIYIDLHPRAGKKSGAWMTTFRNEYKRNGKKVPPVVSIVCNFSRPTKNAPALLTFDEVSTFFHEFGHALNGLLSEVSYYKLPVPPDFVELPSQIMENWAVEPEVLNFYAKHYITGHVIPESLVKKITLAEHFNQGFVTGEYLAASFLDMDFHTLTEIPANFDVTVFEKQALDKMGLIPEIVTRYRSTYFQHIFSGEYSSGYYGYLWAAMLDTDAFEAFKEKGIFDPVTARSFRDNILAKSGADDPLKLYVAFRGRAPIIEPLLQKRGLSQASK